MSFATHKMMGTPMPLIAEDIYETNKTDWRMVSNFSTPAIPLNNAIMQKSKPYIPVHASVLDISSTRANAKPYNEAVFSSKNGLTCTKISTFKQPDSTPMQNVIQSDVAGCDKPSNSMQTEQIAKNISDEYLRCVLKNCSIASR